MSPAHTPSLAARNLGVRLYGGGSDYDRLLALAQGKQFVLLGEATHGTREFYRMRAEITRRLVEEPGFDAVAIEGDWPDAWRVNEFIQGGDGGAAGPLHESMLERAIGVMYVPHTERASHYFGASLAGLFDAVFHVDETEAVEPLHVPERWHRREAALVPA